MDKIIIKDLLLRGIIGINPDERVKKQDILLNIVMYHDIRRAAESDEIRDAANYKEISKRVIEFVENSSYLLVERLVSKLVVSPLERPENTVVQLAPSINVQLIIFS